jgi:hypothetical protein
MKAPHSGNHPLDHRKLNKGQCLTSDNEWMIKDIPGKVAHLFQLEDGGMIGASHLWSINSLVLIPWLLWLF